MNRQDQTKNEWLRSNETTFVRKLLIFQVEISGNWLEKIMEIEEINWEYHGGRRLEKIMEM